MNPIDRDSIPRRFPAGTPDNVLRQGSDHPLDLPSGHPYGVAGVAVTATTVRPTPVVPDTVVTVTSTVRLPAVV